MDSEIQTRSLVSRIDSAWRDHAQSQPSVSPKSIDGGLPLMTKEQFIVLMDRLNLTTVDVADLAGTSRRAVEKWRSGKHPVPQLIVLLLLALVEDKISFDWIGEHLERLNPLPTTKAEDHQEA